MKTRNITILIDKETILNSLIRDACTFGYILISVWFNQNFIGGSYFVNTIILVMGILWLISAWQRHSETGRTFNNEQDAIKYLSKFVEKESGNEE